MNVAAGRSSAGVVIVTPELWGVTRETGGISSFVRHLARLLVANDDHVTVVVGLAKAAELDPAWAERYRQDGVEVVLAAATFPELPVYGYPEGPDFVFRLISEAVDSALPAAADVVYYPDFGGLGLVPLRRNRLSRGRARAAGVTIAHGLSKWVRDGSNRPSHEPVADTSLAFAERYTVERSDFLAVPSRFYRDWLTAQGVRLGEDGRTKVVGYPWLPVDAEPGAAPVPASRFGQLVFFGRLQTIKGFDLFLDALRELRRSRPDLLSELERVVFLGADRSDRRRTREDAVEELAPSGLEAVFLTDLDTWAAGRFLAQSAGDSLVVIPSLLENLPYTVIEASLVPGLDVICSRAGGIPEIVGADHVFEPTPEALCGALEHRLEAGPRPASALPAYDWRAANARWLELHEEAVSRARTRPTPTPRDTSSKRIDVCVPHFNLGPYLPQTLESLAAQTTDAFTVTVVDAGSTDADSLAVFEEMRARYSSHGWRFSSRERGQPGWARNAAVALGDAPYLSFVDGDDVAAPTMLERLLAAIEDSGVDCVTCYAIEFEGDESPLDAEGNLRARPIRLIKPLGGGAASAIFYNPFGLPHCLIRRETFDRLGGYSDNAYWGEYQLYLRLVLSGGAFDVLPEYLFYYRRRADSRTRTGVIEAEARQAILRAFDVPLALSDLQDLPELVRGQHAEIQRLRRLEVLYPEGPRSMAGALTWRTIAEVLLSKARGRARRQVGRVLRRSPRA